MTFPRGLALVPAVAAVAVTAIFASTSASDAKTEKLRFRCKAETETSQFDARYEERTNPKKTRNKFRAHFEGVAGDGLVAGAQLTVLVDALAVGTITLVEEVPGEVEGQLRFDSKGRIGKKAQPFPADFPLIVEGSMVEVTLNGATVLGCELN